MTRPSLFAQSIKNCARCKGDHEYIWWKPFFINEDGLDATHWALCPNTGEPILMLVKED